MAEDYMSDEAATGPMDGGNPTPPPAEEAPESSTALLPIDFFQGKELTPGTVCSVRVEAVQEDQVSVSYVPHEEEEVLEEPGMEAAPLPEDLMA